MNLLRLVPYEPGVLVGRGKKDGKAWKFTMFAEADELTGAEVTVITK